MESYDPEWTPNPSDVDKMYRFEMQPSVVHWNLARLGRTFSEFIGEPLAPLTRPKTRHQGQEPEAFESKNFSFPPRHHLKNGFLFNACKSENIIRELLKEYEPLFMRTFTQLMGQVNLLM